MSGALAVTSIVPGSAVERTIARHRPLNARRWLGLKRLVAERIAIVHADDLPRAAHVKRYHVIRRGHGAALGVQDAHREVHHVPAIGVDRLPVGGQVDARRRPGGDDLVHADHLAVPACRPP